MSKAKEIDLGMNYYEELFMTEEERNVIGGTLQAVRNLNVNLLNALL